jgi:hypothetical protein
MSSFPDPPSRPEESVLLRLVSPLAACFTVDSSFGLFSLVCLSGLAGALYTQLQFVFFSHPPERGGQILRVSPPSASHPQVNPCLSPEAWRLMRSSFDSYPEVYAPLPPRPSPGRVDWSRTRNEIPQPELGGTLPSEYLYGPPRQTRGSDTYRVQKGPTPPVFAKFHSHPGIAGEAFAALLPPLRHRVPNWGEPKRNRT